MRLDHRFLLVLLLIFLAAAPPAASSRKGDGDREPGRDSAPERAKDSSRSAGRDTGTDTAKSERESSGSRGKEDARNRKAAKGREGDELEAERRGHGKRNRRDRWRDRVWPDSDPGDGITREPGDWKRNVVIEVRPKNAEIYAGGLRYGRGKASFPLPSGTWQIDLRAPGYVPLTVTLEVRQGTRYRLERELAPAAQ